MRSVTIKARAVEGGRGERIITHTPYKEPC